jgi:hypothetical protein
MPTARAILAQAAITNAYNPTSKNWNGSGTNAMHLNTDSGGLMSWSSFIVIWIVGICIVALQGSNVRNAAMNFWWGTLASAATCAPRAIKKEWSRTANGC